MGKKTLLLIISIILTFSVCVYGESTDEIENIEEMEEDIVNPIVERAIILEAGEIEAAEDNRDIFGENQKIKLEVISGEYKGKIFEIEHGISGNPSFDVIVKNGDKVIIGIEEHGEGNLKVYIMQHLRQNYILYLVILFILLLIVIGRMKGLKSIITLSLTMIAILKILLPLMLKGMNPILITILVSVGITIFTVFIVSGINNKSIATIIGTSGGVLLAGIIAYIIGNKANLTGFSSEEAVMLMYTPQGIKFDMKGILFSGIIMGALGAVMDVGMSISSSIDEVYNANKDLTREELFSAGMNVGKDVMGTMTNTLILAYTGSSIPLLLVFMAYKTSIQEIINLDVVATEIIRSLAGSIGLVLTIPLTALVASLLLKRKEDSGKEKGYIYNQEYEKDIGAGEYEANKESSEIKND
ncbi:MAG TPA: YibE/F family protein [Tissierellales bacterium]|nr:YibE/F family protein [Tissierellales bacterium]